MISKKEGMKIAVLGGSFLQTDFVESALNKGLEVYVLDGNKDCFISRWENVTFQHLNFSDEALVREFCQRKSIDLIYAPCNEVGNLVSSRLAPEMGFSYNQEAVVQTTLSKSLQRKMAANCSELYTPKSVMYNGDMDQVENFVGYPMVIKPTTSSAGRGITGVNNREELKTAIDAASEFAPEGAILIEELLQGDQISVETVSASGKHHIAGITLEIVDPAPLFVERCHYMNAEVHKKYLSLVQKAVLQLLDAIGVEFGPCHIELKVHNGKVALIEIASRAGGLRDRLMKLAGYPDYNELILEAYMDARVDESLLQEPTGHGLVNILTKVADLESVVLGKRDDTLHSLYLYEKGPVYNPQNIIDAYGYAYFHGEKPLGEYSLEHY